jgi:hypothetical protein
LTTRRSARKASFWTSLLSARASTNSPTWSRTTCGASSMGGTVGPPR